MRRSSGGLSAAVGSVHGSIWIKDFDFFFRIFLK
jgi:hypothetical protein